MVRSARWWFIVTAIGWFSTIASSWLPRDLLPFAGLAVVTIGQGFLLGNHVIRTLRMRSLWIAASFVTNSLALVLFFLAFGQLLMGAAILSTCLRMLGLSLAAGLVTALPLLQVLRKARQPMLRLCAAYALPWPAALALFMIVSWAMGPMPERAPWFLGAVTGVVHGAASAAVLAPAT